MTGKSCALYSSTVSSVVEISVSIQVAIIRIFHPSLQTVLVAFVIVRGKANRFSDEARLEPCLPVVEIDRARMMFPTNQRFNDIATRARARAHAARSHSRKARDDSRGTLHGVRSQAMSDVIINDVTIRRVRCQDDRIDQSRRNDCFSSRAKESE